MDDLVNVETDHIAVAVSGGADSMALCLLAGGWARALGVKLTALTVDHGLRKAAAEEARQVGDWLAARGIAHHILHWSEGPQCASRVQERARQARYALMTAWCRAHGAAQLLLAHHLEDQAETVLMRLRKQSGLMGLAGMAKVRDLDGVRVLRPLLDTPKARLRATLAAYGQDWIEDPSNADLRFERVRVRGLLQALRRHDGLEPRRLARAAAACARVRSVIERAADEALAEGAWQQAGYRCAVSLLVDLSAPVQNVAFSRVLCRVGGRIYPPSSEKLARLTVWLASSPRDGDARTLAGCEVRVRRGQVVFVPEHPRKAQKQG